MPAASWDSQYLLKMFNRKAGRPTADSISDADKYEQLSESQNRVVSMMTAVAPNSLYPKVAYGSIPTLTTTDNQVYTFGTDANGYPVFPMGKGGIFVSLNDIPTNPLVAGRDYMVEGYQIRALNNGTLPVTLYWYGIGQPADITAVVQPALFPEASRELVVIDAVRQFATDYLRNPDLANAMQEEFYGRPDGGRPGAWSVWTMVWKTQYSDGGALNTVTWLDLALAGYGGYSSQWAC